MTTVLKPTAAADVAEVVRWAAAERVALEVAGSRSKAGLGRPVRADHRLDLDGLTGISLYEPEELVMTAAAGTPLAEIVDRLAAHRQQLAFEPPDYGPLLGSPGLEDPGLESCGGGGTIGGVFACNLSGPRRVKAGAARDFLLGLAAVSGRGEAFKAGGRVMKNVTGYDMCKLLVGSFGTLAAVTEVTFKVVPAPEAVRTVLVSGLDDAAALHAMTLALQSPVAVSAAAHLPRHTAARASVPAVAAAGDAAGDAVTALRLEGPAPTIDESAARLAQRLGAAGQGAGSGAGLGADFGAVLDGADSVALWREVGAVAPLLDLAGRQLWRLSVPPAAGAAVAKEIAAQLGSAHHFEHYFDWGGGLIWLAVAGTADMEAAAEVAQHIRAAVAQSGGHALLVRAPEAVRAGVPVFQPQPAALARLTRRLKDGFDPHRVLNPGRMYDGV